MRRALLLLAAALAVACEPAPLPPEPPPAPPPETAAPAPTSAPAPPPPAKLDAIPRLELNRLAAELDLPLFWTADANGDGALEPDEVAVLWGVAPKGTAWIENGAFSPAFLAAYAAMAKVKAEGYPLAGLDEAEKKRRTAVLAELSAGRPTLIRTDLRGASAEDRAIVAHVIAAANVIEHLYDEQLGTASLAAEIPEGDTASRMLFYRNHGPFCDSPAMEKDPACNALPRRPSRVSGLYPQSLQQDPKFCEKLDARADQKVITDPFTVVVDKGHGDLGAVPYAMAYKDEMAAVSRELRAAADAITSPGEAALKAYLEADAKSFLDGDWLPADEAWAKMGVNNSKWYLRVAPDETYGDPCSRKAGFQVSFARINQASVAWQTKLEPVKNAMEGALAKLSGPPYKERKVSFHLPDFIDVVLNAGDARSPAGATVGESLPNWGPLANGGRGRTVAMINFYTDPDSRAAFRDQVESLLCKGSLDPGVYDAEYGTMSTVLHEASHNLGPSAEYEVKGKKDAEVFGGPLAATLEELKAQTSALYLSDWLVEKKVIDARTARLAHASDVLWAFGQIAQGMYTGDGAAKPYPQLASIQVGSFLAAKAVVFHADEAAANGRDKGCFAIDEHRLSAAIAALEKKVLGIKSRGDKAGAVKMREELVDRDGEWKRLRGVIEERWRRAPRASFVYAPEL
jgi:hypothetical protein